MKHSLYFINFASVAVKGKKVDWIDSKTDKIKTGVAIDIVRVVGVLDGNNNLCYTVTVKTKDGKTYALDVGKVVFYEQEATK